MESLLTYIIQVNLLLGIIYLGYIGLLKGLTFYFLNRAYFLVGGLFAFLYPFLDLKSLFVQRGLNMGVVGEQISLYIMEPEVQQQLTLGRLVEIVFMAGAVLLLLKFVFQLLSLLRIHLNSRSDQWRTYLFRNVLIPIVPFSFLNKIYVNKGQHVDAELKDIFKHEDIHVKGLHSLDILLFEMILVCCWYNPFVWLMRRAIRQNLEFLTDQQVLDKGIDKQTYQYSLLNVSKKGTSVGLSNQFNFKLLKRRIMMMNKKRSSKIELSKYAFLLPVFLLTGAAFTVSKAEGSIEGVVEKANETVLPIQLPTVDLKSQEDQSNRSSTALADTLAKANQVEARDFKEIKRSAIDFSKNQKYFVDNKLVSKAEFLAIPEGKLAKYWFSNDSDMIKYRTKSSIDIAGGAILANTVEMQQHSDIAQKKLRCVMNGIVQEKTFTVDDIDPNAIASVSVLQGKAAIDKYGEDVGKDGILEVNLKEGAHIGKDMTKLKGLTIGVTYRDDKLTNDKSTNVVYVIDGKRADQKMMKELAPDGIDNITVLNGASATVKYGSDAANGVVLITTKKWARENPDKVSDKVRPIGQDDKKGDKVVSVVGDKKNEGQDDKVVTVVGYKKSEKSDDGKLDVFSDKSKRISSDAVMGLLGNNSANESIGTDFPSVRVRGYNGKVKPLIVVDGTVKKEASLEKLDSKDIESIEILKNASATALYGSAGKEGVIIVTTRKKASEQKNDEQANGGLKEKVSGVIKMEIEKEKVRAESSN
ncbi:M56 family metallopeptidase [Sphingobacterium siyangense]|uniref:M56 family metallopeptidase n=1 Tax=Sphingobacterium siyangense TaxID=459529 RepID=UPI0019637710|nr:M56 family metallopeptidase [Sphingobacterium siyangense]QRY59053.1 TonB-dependent receptor plug domain-containing protein [Sphingobacterium siyangense]